MAERRDDEGEEDRAADRRRRDGEGLEDVERLALGKVDPPQQPGDERVDDGDPADDDEERRDRPEPRASFWMSIRRILSCGAWVRSIHGWTVMHPAGDWLGRCGSPRPTLRRPDPRTGSVRNRRASRPAGPARPTATAAARPITPSPTIRPPDRRRPTRALPDRPDRRAASSTGSSRAARSSSRSSVSATSRWASSATGSSPTRTGRRRARRLQRRVPDPRDRPRRPRRGRPDRAVRARSSRACAGATTAAANDFGRTVLTVAPCVMAVAIARSCSSSRPWLATSVGAAASTRRPRRCTSSCSGSTACAQILFAASIASARCSSPTGGSCSTPSRRSCTRPGSSSGPCCRGAVRDRRHGLGAVAGAAAHLGIRAIGTLRTTFRIRPAVRDPDAGVPRVHPADAAADAQPPDRAADVHLLHASSPRASAVGSVSAVNFAADYQVVPVSLIGVVVLAGRLPGPGRGVRRRRRRGVPRGPAAATS